MTGPTYHDKVRQFYECPYRSGYQCTVRPHEQSDRSEN